MPGVISSEGTRDLNRESRRLLWVDLVTIIAEGYDTAYLVHDNQDLISRGNLHIAAEFDAPKPDEFEDRLPGTQIKISNVDRRMIEMVRSINSEVTFRIETVTREYPDTVEETYNLTLKSVEYDVLWVTGQLGYEDILNEPALPDTYTPSRHPAIF